MKKVFDYIIIHILALIISAVYYIFYPYFKGTLNLTYSDYISHFLKN